MDEDCAPSMQEDGLGMHAHPHYHHTLSSTVRLKTSLVLRSATLFEPFAFEQRLELRAQKKDDFKGFGGRRQHKQFVRSDDFLDDQQKSTEKLIYKINTIFDLF